MKAEGPLIATDGESENQTRPGARLYHLAREGGCGAVPRTRQLFPLYFNIGIPYVEYKFVIRIFRVREGARG